MKNLKHIVILKTLKEDLCSEYKAPVIEQVEKFIERTEGMGHYLKDTALDCLIQAGEIETPYAIYRFDETFSAPDRCSFKVFQKTYPDGTTKTASCIICDYNGCLEQYYTDDPELFKGENDIQVSLVSESDVWTTKAFDIIIAFDMKKIDPVITIYNREQHYGGAEEGGWYYHTDKAGGVMAMKTYVANNFDASILGKNETKDHELSDEYNLNSYGEGKVYRTGFYYGEHENLNQPYYC